MSTITTINGSDTITSSRTVINTNFSNLNTDKFEASNVDTDTTLAANSDSKVPSQKAVKAYIDAGGATNIVFVPVGAMLPFGGSAAPANFFLCNGASKDTTTYATLFAILGYAYGGSGSSFNLPNLQNRIPLGAGSATVVGTFASRASNVITVTGLTNKANNEFQTGQAVTYHTSGSVMTGLTNDTVYYIVRTGNLTFSLATTLANAQNSTVISLSSDGTGTQTFTLTFTTRAVGDYGGEENHAMSSTELLSHTHTLTIADSGFGSGQAKVDVNHSRTSDGNIADANGGNIAMNIMSPFVVVNYIIRYV